MSNDNASAIERVTAMAEKCGMSVAPSGNGYWDNASQLLAFEQMAVKAEIEKGVLEEAVALIGTNYPVAANLIWQMIEVRGGVR